MGYMDWLKFSREGFNCFELTMKFDNRLCFDYIIKFDTFIF